MYKKFKYKNFKILILVFYSILNTTHAATSDQEFEKSFNNIEQAIKKEPEIKLDDLLPQLKAYANYIPNSILDILKKLPLKNFQVYFDSSNKTGIINATSNLLGQDCVIRITAGLAGQTNKGELSEKLKNNAMAFQEQYIKSREFKNPEVKQVGQTLYFGQEVKPENTTKDEVMDKLITNPVTENKDNKIQIAKQTDETLKTKLKEDNTKTEEGIGKIKQSIANLKDKGIAKGKEFVLTNLVNAQIGMVITLPSGFSFAKLDNNLKFLDVIQAEKLALCVGTGFKDPIYGTIPAGLAVIADIKMAEPFTTINKFVSKASKNKINLSEKAKLMLKGNITPSISGSSLSMGLGEGLLSFNLAGKKILDTDNLNLYAILLPTPVGSGVSGISFGLSTGLNLYLKNINNDLQNLKFIGSFSIDTSLSAILTGSMDGKLSLKSIGLPIEFGNITLQVGMNPENIETLGLSDIGMAGEFDFGAKDRQAKITAAFDVRISGQQSNILAYGQIQPMGQKRDALELLDILYLAGLDDSKQLFDNNIPNLAIKDAKFYFSPVNILFANKVWPAGFNVGVTLDLLGVDAQAEINIDKDGIEATGYLSPVELGPLKITGAGKSKKCSTHDECLKSCRETSSSQEMQFKDPKSLNNAKEIKDDKQSPKALNEIRNYDKKSEKGTNQGQEISKGAIINLDFKPTKSLASLFLNADIQVDLNQLGKIAAEACIKVSTKGLTAKFSAEILKELEAYFTLQMENFKSPKDWYVCAKMQQKAINDLQKVVSKFVEESKAEISKGLEKARDNVTSAEKKFNNAISSAKKQSEEADKVAADLKKRLDNLKNKCGI